MQLKTNENSKNYACSVVEIKNIFPIEGADAIVRTVVNGNNVVIPKTISVGDRMLYFVSGTRLSADFCKYNNLYDKEEENADTSKKGFISFRQKRIKAIKLRGVISDGMLITLDSLFYFLNDISWLKIGDEFTDIANTQICEKYGLSHVQEYFVGKVKEMVVDNSSLLGYLQQIYLNKSYPDCKIDEGICIRLRGSDEIFKLKSPNFIKMESDNQENEIEENES